MMKRILVLTLCVVLCLGCIPVSAVNSTQALSTDIAFELNNKPLNIETYNIGDYGFYKLRDIAAMCEGTAKEFSVKWDENAQMITLTSNEDYTVTTDDLQPGGGSSQIAYESSATVIVNGVEVSLTAYNINDYTYYKLRELCNALDIYVSWNEDTRTSGINTTKNYDGTDVSGTTKPTRPVLDSEDVYAKCSSSVFYIEVYDANGAAFASGSGFFIDNSGTAVTNFHVIDGAHSAKITLKSGEVYNVKGVYDYSIENDWAVLQIDGSGFDCLTIGDKATVVGGAKVYALGCPLGLQDTFSDGMISNANRVVDGVTYIQISAPISHGSSGGALINKYGEVIGICSAGFVDGQNLNLAIPITAIEGYSRSSLTTLAELFPAPTQPDQGTTSRQQLAYDALRDIINEVATGTNDSGFAYYAEKWDSENYVWFTNYDSPHGEIEVCACYMPWDYDIQYWACLYFDPDNSSFDYYITINEYTTDYVIFKSDTVLSPPTEAIVFDSYTIGSYYRDMESEVVEMAEEISLLLLTDILNYTDTLFSYAHSALGYPLYNTSDFGF